MSSPANPVRTVAIRNAHPQLRLARPAITAAIAILDQHAARFLRPYRPCQRLEP